MPPDTHLTVIVVACKARFFTEEDLSSLLILMIPHHVTPAEFAVSCSVCGCQVWLYQWAMGMEVHSMQVVPDGLTANVHISGHPQLPPYGAGSGSSGL